MGLDFTHPIRIFPFCETPVWGGSATLQRVLDSLPDLSAAAIMTVVGPDGPSRWNTPDGRRWTQDQAIAARMRGLVPTIMTPWRFVRSGPDFAGSVPSSVEVMLEGGAIGSDLVAGDHCIMGVDPPLPGRSYLTCFGRPEPGSYGTILAAWPYDPVTHALDGPWGRTWLHAPPAAAGRLS